MLIRKAYKFKLRFHDGSEALPLFCFAGCCRFIWNTALAFQKERLDAGKHILSYEELTGKLVSWKKQYPLLKEAPSQSLQQRLKDLDRSG